MAAVNVDLKKISRGMHVKISQIELIVATLEANPQINGMKFSSSYTASKRNEEWGQLSYELNALGGAVKDTKCWQKCWSDKKSDVKKKNNAFKNAMLKTGGGRNEERHLTPIEERILLLIGLDAAEGAPIEESGTMANGVLIPREEDCPSSQPSGSFHSETYQLDLEGCLLPDSNLPNSDRQTSSTAKTKDNRLPSYKRVRTKPVLLKADIAQKMLESQLGITAALQRFAEATEKQNELRERALLVEQQKADAFVGIFNLLQNKLS